MENEEKEQEQWKLKAPIEPKSIIKYLEELGFQAGISNVDGKETDCYVYKDDEYDLVLYSSKVDK